MPHKAIIELHPGEETLVVRRRHWLPFATQVAGLAVAALAPIFLFAATSFLPYSAQVTLATFQTFPLFLWIAWLLFLWVFFGVSWTNYYLDTLLVTNKRVIDIDQIGLFARDVAEVRIAKIEDIRVEVLGIIPSFFHYGNLHIQTAGESREFIIHNIPRPQKIADAISRTIDALHAAGPAE